VKKFVNQSLKSFNTFGFDVSAAEVYEVTQNSDLNELFNLGIFKRSFKIISGGSNLLLTKDIEMPIILIRNTGIKLIEETQDHIYLEVSAGENWHEFVLHTVDRSWGGIENLSLIPGCVGAAPIQNIGAYGTEVKDTITRVNAFNINSGDTEIFENEQCKFGYRDSIFKNQVKDQYIITSVCFKLHKKWTPKTEYGDIKKQLSDNGIINPSIKSVSEAIIQIRQSKLPDPSKIGNSGSFFKNPVISKARAEELTKLFPTIKTFNVNDFEVKVAAAWLIDSLGWKGHQENNIGVHEKQALVLINKGGGKGKDILTLAQKIQESVKVKFGIQLEFEVNIW